MVGKRRTVPGERHCRNLYGTMGGSGEGKRWNPNGGERGKIRRGKKGKLSRGAKKLKRSERGKIGGEGNMIGRSTGRNSGREHSHLTGISGEEEVKVQGEEKGPVKMA